MTPASSPGRAGSDQVAIAKALSHPLRHRILFALARGTASPSRLAAEFAEPVPSVSYHVKILARLGLIELVKTTKARGGVEHFYRSVAPPMITDRLWQQLPPQLRGDLMSGLLDEIAAGVRASAKAGLLDRADAHVSRLPLVLDREARAKLDARLAQLVSDCIEIQRESDARQPPPDRRRRSMLALLNLDQPPP